MFLSQKNEKEKENQQLQTSVATLKKLLEDLNDQKQEMQISLDQKINELSKKLSEQKKEIENKDTELATLNDTIFEKNEKLHEIQESLGRIELECKELSIQVSICVRLSGISYLKTIAKKKKKKNLV